MLSGYQRAESFQKHSNKSNKLSLPTTKIHYQKHNPEATSMRARPNRRHAPDLRLALSCGQKRWCEKSHMGRSCRTWSKSHIPMVRISNHAEVSATGCPRVLHHVIAGGIGGWGAFHDRLADLSRGVCQRRTRYPLSSLSETLDPSNFLFGSNSRQERGQHFRDARLWDVLQIDLRMTLTQHWT